MPTSKRSKKSKFRARRRRNKKQGRGNLYRNLKQEGLAALALATYKLNQPTQSLEPKSVASNCD